MGVIEFCPRYKGCITRNIGQDQITVLSRRAHKIFTAYRINKETFELGCELKFRSQTCVLYSVIADLKLS